MRGPREVARVVDATVARAVPELAARSAMVHRDDDAVPIALAAFDAIARLDEEHARLYHDLVSASLGDRARAALEDLVITGKYEYPQSEFAKKHFERGRETGEEALRVAIRDLCTLLAIELGPDRAVRLDAMKLPELDALRAALVHDRRWPG